MKIDKHCSATFDAKSSAREPSRNFDCRIHSHPDDAQRGWMDVPVVSTATGYTPGRVSSNAMCRGNGVDWIGQVAPLGVVHASDRRR